MSEIPSSYNPELSQQPELEKEKRGRYFANIFERGLDIDDCIGYHGTSIETIQYVMDCGVLPGASRHHDEVNNPYVIKEGSIHFYPRKNAFPGHPVMSTFKDEKSIISYTADYAEQLAERHYLLSRFGITLGNTEATEAAFELLDPDPHVEFPDYFLRNGATMDDLQEALFKARKRKGVVLSLSPAVLLKYRTTLGDRDEGDLAIQCPEGLPYELLSGLEPMGEYELEWFERLQEMYSP